MPTITDVTAAAAYENDTVTITGTDLDAASAVQFNGVAAQSFTQMSSTHISAVVPATTAGPVTVTTPGGTASWSTFTPRPSVKVLATLADVSGGVSIAKPGYTGVASSAVCRLSDSAVLFAHTTADLVDHGAVSLLTVGEASVTAGSETVIDAADYPLFVGLVRLDDTHALLLCFSQRAADHVNVNRVAVITVTGTTVTVGSFHDTDDITEYRPRGFSVFFMGRICALSPTRVLVGVSKLFTVSSTTVGEIALGGAFTVATVTALSATQALVVSDNGIFGFYEQYLVQVADLTGDVLTLGTSVAANVGNGEAPNGHSGWVLTDGTVWHPTGDTGSAWLQNFGTARWMFTPHGMSAPGSSFVAGVSLGSDTPWSLRSFDLFTNGSDTLISYAFRGTGAETVNGMVGVDSSGGVYQAHAPLVLSADPPHHLVGLASRVLLVQPDPTTGVAIARLLSLDLFVPPPRQATAGIRDVRLYRQADVGR